MIDHIWSIVCGRSTTDRETNNLSLIDVMEQLNVLGPLPDPSIRAALPVQYEVVSLWSRSQPLEAEETKGRIKLITPTGNEALAYEFPVNLLENPRMRTQLRSFGFPLSGVGRYLFLVEIQRGDGQWETVARLPMQLESVTQMPGSMVVPQNS